MTLITVPEYSRLLVLMQELSPIVPDWHDTQQDANLEWHHMIYQLDFGGRVTTKSAKNFQLEIGSEQVRTIHNNTHM